MTIKLDNLDARATLPAEPRSDGPPERSGSTVGAGAPPPPPAPSAGNVDPRVIADQIKTLTRQRRDARIAATSQRIRGVHQRYWVYAGIAVAAAAGVVACRSYTADQRATAMALAQIGAGAQTTQTAPPTAPTVVGMPNPLQPLPLSNEAVYLLGAEYKTNDAGEAVGFTDLPPIRSAAVVTDLLADLNLCNVYVSLGPTTEVVVSFEPSAGAYPLIDPTSEMCAAPLTTTAVSVPSDPVPPTVAGS